MGDPAVAGATTATDTDYALESMTQAFIERAGQSANRYTALQGDAQGRLSAQFANMGELASNWLGSITQIMPQIIVTAIQGLNASTADSILNYIATGSRMASASPPIPSNFGVIPQGVPGAGTVTPNGGGSTALLSALQAFGDRLSSIEARLTAGKL